jgi:hypothetical protein
MCRIVYLSIYNHSEDYAKMKCSQESYLTFLKSQGIHINFFFIMFDKLDTDFIFDEKTYTLRINGEESHLPGILNKTIKAFDIITHKLNIHYDFLFRTNISTFIHFKQAFHILSKVKNPSEIPYYIGPFIQVNWIIPMDGGIKDGVTEKHHGQIFALGTCIILSKPTIQHILNNPHLLSHDVVDDVAIGIYLTTHVANIQIIIINDFYCWDNNFILNPSHICYKNNEHKDNRHLDVNRLDSIVHIFILKHRDIWEGHCQDHSIATITHI